MADNFIPTPDDCNMCAYVEKTMEPPKGRPNRFTRKCSKCGDRLFVWTSPKRKPFMLWRSQCPKGTKFYDFVLEKVGEHVSLYAIRVPSPKKEAPTRTPVEAVA